MFSMMIALNLNKFKIIFNSRGLKNIVMKIERCSSERSFKDTKADFLNNYFDFFQIIVKVI